MKTTDHQFVAVGARKLTDAQAFAKLFDIPKAYGSYEELAKDPDVQVVYIGTVNSQHLPAAKLMLENGKHILMEKPLTINTKQNEELFALAKSKKLFAMEALWSRFLPSYEFAFQELAKGTIGDVLHVTANLGFPNADVIRVATKELGGGTVLDVGVYAINIVEQVFGGEVPEKVEAVGHLNKNGVDFDFAAALQYKNQKTASISCHSMLTLENEATIVGTKGIIKLGANFHACQKVYVNDKVHEFTFPEPIVPTVYGSTGLCYEANEVRKCLKAGQLESSVMSGEASLTISRIQDAIRKQIGVVYDVDPPLQL